MKIRKSYLVMTTSLVLLNSQANAEGYYFSSKLIAGNQYSNNMDTSLRIGINPSEARYVEIDNKDSIRRGAFAFGYQFNNRWQVEMEYNTKFDTTYITSVDGGPFNGSNNNYQISSERLMLNTYHEIPVHNVLSIYGQLGLGIAKIEVGGWQGNQSRRYDSNTQSNISYSFGAGIRSKINKEIVIDLGYRYSGLGKVESGFNDFANSRNQRDEQMKAVLAEHETYFGVKYIF